MIDIVLQIIKHYLDFWQKPTKNDISIKDENLLNSRWNIFVTIYKNGEIVWNSGNVVEIENDLVNELIENTIWALEDKRFPNLDSDDLNKIKLRIDIIKNRKIFWSKIEEFNPIKFWILAIKKDYEKLAVILPNISPTLTSPKDCVQVLSKKLNEEFNIENYIVYELETESVTNY